MTRWRRTRTSERSSSLSMELERWNWAHLASFPHSLAYRKQRNFLDVLLARLLSSYCTCLLSFRLIY